MHQKGPADRPGWLKLGLYWRRWINHLRQSQRSLETDLGGHSCTVLVPQMAVRFHAKTSPVLMSKPSADGRNIKARFDATSCEQMVQIMPGHAMDTDLFAGTCFFLRDVDHREN